MAIAGYQYRVGDGAWVDAEGATVSLTGLSPGVRFSYQVRAKDAAGNFSEPSAVFYVTTPYALGLLTYGDGDVLSSDGSEGLMALVGHYLEPAV